MRIDRLELIRYGKFTDQTVELPRAARDFHVIVGPNEAGKSTLRSAIHHLLYGFPLRNPGYAFLHPLPDLRLGAQLSHGEQRLAFQRIKANRATLRAPDDSPLPEDSLAPLLGGADSRFFEQMFCLDHERLVRGGASILSAADDEVGQVLFESAAGIAALGPIRAELEQEADGLWGKRKSAARVYYQAEQAHEQARQAFRAACLRAKDWAEAHANVTALQADLQAALERHAALKARRTVLERTRRVAPLLAALDSETARLAEQSGAAELPDTAAATLEQAERRLAGLALQRSHQLRLREAAEQALRGLQLDSSLLDHQDDILALDELRLQYRAHAADIEKRERDVQSRWAAITALAAQLGWDCGSEDALERRMPGQPARAALARLARQHDALARARDAAERARRHKQREVAQARGQLQGLAQAQVQPALRAAMARAHALGDPAAALRDLHAGLAGEQRALAVARQALVGEAIDLPALAAMLVPTREQVQSLLEAHRHDQAQAQRLDEELRKLGDQLDATRAASRRMREQQHPVLLQDLRHARLERDQAWHAIRLDPSTAATHGERYERLVAQADSLADERHDRAHAAAELQGLEDQRSALQLEQDSLRRSLEELKARLARRDDDWNSLLQECRLPRLSIHAASEWLLARERVLAAWQGVAAAEQRLGSYQDAASRAAHALAQELQAAGLQPGGTDLAVLLTQAEEHVRQQDESRGQRRSLEQQLGSADADLQALADEAGAADEAYRAWSQAWQHALAGAGFEPGQDTATVDAALDLIGRIDDQLASIRQIRGERIDTMRADLRDLDSRARGLALRLRPGLAGQPAAEVAIALRRELAEARTTEAEIERLRAQLAQASAALEAAEREEQEVRASLATLMHRSGAQDLAQLRSAIERSDARRRLQQRVDDARKALLEQGDGLPLAALRAQAESQDLGAAVAELAELGGHDGPEEAVVRRIAELSASLRSAEALWRAMAGQADAASAETARQQSLARMTDAVERYIKVHTAARLLAWSIERYRDARQGPMLAAASAIFAGLTLGSFERLLVDFDSQPPTLHGRRPDGSSVGVEGMSEGTRDQLYLALRLAALDMHLARAHALPFVADDLFIQFDDRRSHAGLQALAALSERTQVLFLSHHDHLLELVRQVFGDSVNIVRLAA